MKWQASAGAPNLPFMKNKVNTSEVGAEQVTKQTTTQKAEAIYLGIDLHKATIMITRIVDHSTPQPAQKFRWDQFWPFVQKQGTLAKKVYALYEAGAFGFWVARQLQAMNVEAYVGHPEKLDPHHKRVQTDKLDRANWPTSCNATCWEINGPWWWFIFRRKPRNNNGWKAGIGAA
jgi:hypothetical protein